MDLISDGDASTIPNQQMIDGVKEFQKDNNLHVDGMLKPKGETITTMNGKLKDFYANKKYESGTEKGEKEYIKWALKQMITNIYNQGICNFANRKLCRKNKKLH